MASPTSIVAVEKAHGDRQRAITFVCRLYHVRTLDALPSAIRAAALALLDALPGYDGQRRARRNVAKSR